jgi:hypothetical protein
MYIFIYFYILFWSDKGLFFKLADSTYDNKVYILKKSYRENDRKKYNICINCFPIDDIIKRIDRCIKCDKQKDEYMKVIFSNNIVFFQSTYDIDSLNKVVYITNMEKEEFLTFKCDELNRYQICHSCACKYKFSIYNIICDVCECQYPNVGSDLNENMLDRNVYQCCSFIGDINYNFSTKNIIMQIFCYYGSNRDDCKVGIIKPFITIYDRKENKYIDKKIEKNMRICDNCIDLMVNLGNAIDETEKYTDEISLTKYILSKFDDNLLKKDDNLLKKDDNLVEKDDNLEKKYN